MARPRIFQLIYRSTFQRGRIDSPLAMLREIVKESRIRNEQAGVTGFMLFDGISFLQTLEGSEENVRATYARIGRDPRHRDVNILATRITIERDFPDWSMEGHLGRQREQDILKRYGILDGDIGRIRPADVVALIKEIAEPGRNPA